MDFEQARINMVERQIRPGDVLDVGLLDALLQIPREKFVASGQELVAYTDAPLPLVNGGVMLTPMNVAKMVQALALKPTDRVLEIGTGSGYVTALLSILTKAVVTVDIDAEQHRQAKMVLDSLGYHNISYKVGDGFTGVEEEAPFQAIYIGGACTKVPESIIKQLSLDYNGRMIVIEGYAPAMKANLYFFEDEQLKKQTIFEANIPYLNEQCARPAFDF